MRRSLALLWRRSTRRRRTAASAPWWKCRPRYTVYENLSLYEKSAVVHSREECAPFKKSPPMYWLLTQYIESECKHCNFTCNLCHILSVTASGFQLTNASLWPITTFDMDRNVYAMQQLRTIHIIIVNKKYECSSKRVINAVCVKNVKYL